MNRLPPAAPLPAPCARRRRLLRRFGPAARAADAPAAASANPFDAPSTLPFQAPDFARIKGRRLRARLRRAMRRHLAEVRAIADNPAAPTFENTFVALRRAGRCCRA